MSKPIERKITSGKNISYWVDSQSPISYSSLGESIETEIVIVGGGIAGVTTAYRLSQLGKKVVLVEDGNICSGETGRTTAHLVTALDDRYETLERIFGKDGARIAYESNRAAIDFVRDTIQQEKIDCDFELLSGYLFRHPSDEPDSLDREYKAAKEAGVEVQFVDRVPGLIKDVGRALEFSNQAQFHPIKYLRALCNSINRNGGRIFTDTHAKEISEEGIETDKGHKVKAEHIVVATNAPVNSRLIMPMKQFAYRTYVIAARIKKGSLPHVLWWDTGDYNTNKNIPPYHYIRVQTFDELYDLLISGGEDHPTGLADADVIPEEARYDMVETWTRERFPIEDVVYHWSGQVMEPMDSLGFIGRNPWDKKNIYIISGDSGNGITNGTIGGLLIPDLIMGRENEWEKIYNPSRLNIFSSGNVWFKEFVGGFAAYLKTEPDGKNVKLSDIKVGGGEIIEIANEKYGAYCDENYDLHLVAAKCTHLGCTVKWNNDEKSWDCPCHGSRFTHEGKVLNGPANVNLRYHKEMSAVHHHI
jgi:glycine/D-amino acid oxidase-like deaminating enzyme/nitrite reductase/ring-hydroxylating ferredoxin subunit